VSILFVIILAVVEGITEFLPVSSTGHLIITNEFLGISSDDFAKLFIIVIQLGAILSVVVLYWKRFFQFKDLREATRFYLQLLVAFLPAVVFGLLLKKYIHQMLGDVLVVAISLFIGGFLLIYFDKYFRKNEDRDEEPLTFRKSLAVGLFQVMAMIPGVSRSGATIVGGLAQGMKRKQAAEFSFFLAVPTMFAATVKDLYDNKDLLQGSNISTLVIGTLISFVVAMIAIKFFINYLTKHGFRLFGYYRIIVGLLLILLILFGHNFSDAS